MKRAAYRLRTLTALLLMCALLSACGNKGPLVHPEQAPASSSTSAATR